MKLKTQSILSLSLIGGRSWRTHPSPERQGDMECLQSCPHHCQWPLHQGCPWRSQSRARAAGFWLPHSHCQSRRQEISTRTKGHSSFICSEWICQPHHPGSSCSRFHPHLTLFSVPQLNSVLVAQWLLISARPWNSVASTDSSVCRFSCVDIVVNNVVHHCHGV